MLKSILILGFVFFGALASADTYEGGIDRPGFDYTNFELISPRAILCQWRCQQARGYCRAWTYVKPGIQGTNARCWLKNRVPNPIRSSCCTSGILQ